MRFGKIFFSKLTAIARNELSDWTPMDIEVILTNDAVVRELNARYRKQDRVTDVLSFAYPSEAGEKRATGEIYIAREQALRQALRYRVSEEREIARLAIHGILHVQGHDHVRAGERKKMRALEQKIFCVWSMHSS